MATGAVFIAALGAIFTGGSAAESTPPPAPAADATTALPSGTVFYRDSGGPGVPVIFLHAASGNSMMWEPQVTAITAAGFRFIAIDYRGLRTGSGQGAGSVALIDELVTKLGLPKFHLLGTAAGGGVVLQYLLVHPEKVRSGIVTNSTGSVQDPEYTQVSNRLRPAGFNQLPLEFRELGPSYRAANPEGVKRWLELSAGTGAAAPARGAAPAGAPSAEAPAAARGAAAGGNNADPTVTWARLEALQMPVLLMTGDADLYTPPSVLRLFAARIKQSEFVVVPESGHSSYWENPELFNRTLLGFIRKH